MLVTEEQKSNIIEAVARKYTELNKQHFSPYALLWDEMRETMQNMRFDEAALHMEAVGLWTLIERLEKMRDRGYGERGTFTGDNDYIDMVLHILPGYKKEWE